MGFSAVDRIKIYATMKAVTKERCMCVDQIERIGLGCFSADHGGT